MTSTPKPEESGEAAEDWMRSLGIEGQSVHEGGKRLGMEWAPWMGDWFTSYSPRNDNSNAEGYWDHWVDLALRILRDPLTGIVRPEAHAAVAAVEPFDQYSGASRTLTGDELMARFRANPGPQATR
jgi:hypothetical protein